MLFSRPFVAVLLSAVLLGGCTPAAASPDPPVVPADPATALAGAGQPLRETVRLQVAQGSEARYRAREQLAGVSLPNDAVGTTSAVTGTLVLGPDGQIVRDESKFVIDLRSLQSDDRLRDRFIQMATLQTARFPNAEFVPEAATTPFWSGGQASFQLPGELTVHGVQKAVTLDVSATITKEEVTGTATTEVTLADFGMQTPRVPLVLSIEETIQLEVDFKLVRR